MESKSQERLSDHAVPVYVLPYADRNDEISLIDLWHVIAARKKLVLLSFLGAIIFAFAYVFLAEPQYRAEAYLLPPQQQDIQGLLIDYRGKGSLEIKRYTPAIVYEAFLKNLKSQGLRRDFFDTRGLIAHYKSRKKDSENDIDRIFDENFNVHLTVQADKQDATFVIAGFSDRDPKLAAQWLNQFIVFANARTVEQYFNDVNTAIRAEIERVRYHLASKVKLAEQRRRDNIINLSEALRVARILGIENTNALPITSNERQAEIAVNMAKVPLYMRGVKALETEIEVLKSRKSDEPFIKGLRDLQEKRVFLEGISVDLEALSAVTIDATARIPYRPERPRKLLIMVLSGFFGLVAGIFLVFIADFRS